MFTEEETQKYAYHSIKSDADVYHVCRNCTEGNDIEPENRSAGKGDKKKLCEKCKSMKQCDMDTEERVRSREKGLKNWKKMQKGNPNLK